MAIQLLVYAWNHLYCYKYLVLSVLKEPINISRSRSAWETNVRPCAKQLLEWFPKIKEISGWRGGGELYQHFKSSGCGDLVAVQEAAHEQPGFLGGGGVLVGGGCPRHLRDLGQALASGHTLMEVMFASSTERELRETWLRLSAVNSYGCRGSVKVLEYPRYIWKLYSSTFQLGFQLPRTSPTKN